MKRLVVPLEEFDLQSFVRNIIDFCREDVNPEIDPSSVIVSAKDYSLVPEWEPEDGNRDIEKEIVEEGLLLFFPFNAIDSDESHIKCADGNIYEIPAREDEDFDYDEFLPFIPDYMNMLGYAIRLDGKDLVIESAVHYLGAHVAPPPSIDPIENCGILDKALYEYIKGFVVKR